jgi:Tfp pilus assembly protein PilZ
MEKVAPLAATEACPTEPALRKIRIPFIRRGTVAVAGAREDLFIVDLGLRGVFIERPQPLAPGQEIELWFPLPGNEIPVRARCRVAWWRSAEAAAQSRTTAGIGVEFVEISDGDAERLRRHLLEYLQQHPRQRRFLRHPEEAEEEA